MPEAGSARACPEEAMPGSTAKALPLPTAVGGCASTLHTQEKQPHPGAPATQAWVLVPREGSIGSSILDVAKGEGAV